MAKKVNAYAAVSSGLLKGELEEILVFLKSEVIETLEDRIEWKPTKTGGIAPSVVAVIEEQINVQVLIIEKACKMLKSIYHKESMTSFVQENIDVVVDKLAEILAFYKTQAIGEIQDRFAVHTYIDKKGVEKNTRFLACKKEYIRKFRMDIMEKIYAIEPLILELQAFKEAVSVKGGGEIPESMRYD